MESVKHYFQIALPYAVVGIGYILLFCSLIFLPILLFNLPLIIVLFLLSKYTRFGGHISKFYDWLFYKSDKPRKFLWKMMYNIMCLIFPHAKWTVMNYGYAELTSDGKTLTLPEENEGERFGLQMYNYVATCAGLHKDLSKKEVLEIGSGRGGGISFISKKAKKCYGIDVSDQQVYLKPNKGGILQEKLYTYKQSRVCKRRFRNFHEQSRIPRKRLRLSLQCRVLTLLWKLQSFIIFHSRNS